jgi:transcriptional regulator of aromatic amino acid metabolism
MDVSRYEINRQVRGVLNRHDIDLAKIDYSCIGGTVYLSGELFKTNDCDIVPAMIESLFKEIARISGVRNVQSDLQNWSISASRNSWQITKIKKKLRDTGMAEAAEDVHIGTSEEIAEVLNDMQEKPDQED